MCWQAREGARIARSEPDIYYLVLPGVGQGNAEG